MKVPEYFKDHELSCKCGCGAMPRKSSVERLYAVRILAGFPIGINSGARCRTHNTAIGGADRSEHITDDSREGTAFDCSVARENRHEFLRLAMLCGFTGIGPAKTFVHIDDGHDNPAVWTYG